MDSTANSLRNSTVLGVRSLQDRSARAGVLRELTALAALPAPITAEQICDLVVFEKTLYSLIRTDKRWYFARLAQAEAIEFARDIQILHSAAAKALVALVGRRGEWSRSDDDPLLQRIIGFCLYHQGAAIKWCFMRHEPLHPTAWTAAHALYRLAEQVGLATYPMRLFDEEGEQRTTLQALYLRPLLVDVLNTGSLSTAQIEIVDAWLAGWTTDYALDTDYSPDRHALFVDLDAPSGMHLAAGAADGSSRRYLRIDSLKRQIDAVRDAMRSGHAFHGRGVPNEFPVEVQVGLLEIIERVHQTLFQANASTLEQRTPIGDLRADVRLGISAVHAAINSDDAPAQVGDTHKIAGASPVQFGGIELTLTPSQTPDNDEHAPTPGKHSGPRWQVHDMSPQGFGLIASRAESLDIDIGTLIAIKPDGFAHWLVGLVVRKIAQRPALTETLLGVELLSVRPLPVLFTRFSHAVDAEPDPNLAPVAAIYLAVRPSDGDGVENGGGGDVLLLPAGDFGLKTTFSLATRAARFRVRINRVVRKGRDWVGLRFEVIARKDWPAADSRSHR